MWFRGQLAVAAGAWRAAKYMTVSQVAERLQLAEVSIRRKIRDAEILDGLLGNQ